MRTEQLDRRRRQAPRRSAKPRPLSSDEQAWIHFRTRVGWELDDFLRSKPSEKMRLVVRELEATLADGDRASGLL